VSFVDPVKVADGQHGLGERFFDLVEVKNDLHDEYSSKSLIKYCLILEANINDSFEISIHFVRKWRDW